MIADAAPRCDGFGGGCLERLDHPGDARFERLRRELLAEHFHEQREGEWRRTRRAREQEPARAQACERRVDARRLELPLQHFAHCLAQKRVAGSYSANTL